MGIGWEEVTLGKARQSQGADWWKVAARLHPCKCHLGCLSFSPCPLLPPSWSSGMIWFAAMFENCLIVLTRLTQACVCLIHWKCAGRLEGAFRQIWKSWEMDGCQGTGLTVAWMLLTGKGLVGRNVGMLRRWGEWVLPKLGWWLLTGPRNCSPRNKPTWLCDPACSLSFFRVICTSK